MIVRSIWRKNSLQNSKWHCQFSFFLCEFNPFLLCLSQVLTNTSPQTLFWFHLMGALQQSEVPRSEAQLSRVISAWSWQITHMLTWDITSAPSLSTIKDPRAEVNTSIWTIFLLHYRNPGGWWSSFWDVSPAWVKIRGSLRPHINSTTISFHPFIPQQMTLCCSIPPLNPFTSLLNWALLPSYSSSSA